jgi:hypothetical protein
LIQNNPHNLSKFSEVSPMITARSSPGIHES